MQPEDRIRILHMVEAAEAALDFAAGRQRTDLDSDRMLTFALVRAVEVLGEAAGKVSGEIRVHFPEVPWALIVAMRNRLVHAYFDINRDILWATVQDELPVLLPLLRGILGSSP